MVMHRVVEGVLERVWCIVNESVIIVVITPVLMLLVTYDPSLAKSSMVVTALAEQCGSCTSLLREERQRSFELEGDLYII